MVLSYTTSPAYHIIEEKTDRYAAAPFAEGHYLQVEVAGRLKEAAHPELARRFLAFMLTPGFQDHIATRNWMWPAAATSKPLPEAFGRLMRPERTLTIPPEEVAAKRKAWIDEWLAVMSR
jgi:thiamine transport system substrate-binding protein